MNVSGFRFLALPTGLPANDHSVVEGLNLAGCFVSTMWYRCNTLFEVIAREAPLGLRKLEHHEFLEFDVPDTVDLATLKPMWLRLMASVTSRQPDFMDPALGQFILSLNCGPYKYVCHKAYS